MKNSFIVPIGIFLFLICLCTGCTVKAVKPMETGKSESPYRVLIATQQSEFKKELVSRTLEGLTKHPCYVKKPV